MAGSLTREELEGIRIDQEAELDAQCLIWRETSPGTISKVTGEFMSPQTETIYEGPCSFAPIVSRRDRFDVHGEQQVYQNQNRLLIPWDAFEVKIGDFCRITESEDQDLNLKDMVVKDVLLVSDLTLRRLTLIDILE